MEVMTLEEKIASNEAYLKQATKDYLAHTDLYLYDGRVFGDRFISAYAELSTYAKDDLRNLFRNASDWNEQLDAIVTEVQYESETPSFAELAEMLDVLFPAAFGWHELAYQYDKESYRQSSYLQQTVRALCNVLVDHFQEKERYLVIKDKWHYEYLADRFPNVMVEGRKLTRIVQELVKRFGTYDSAPGSSYQKVYATLADKITKPIVTETLFISINPAHFLTMSNPKADSRGQMLTSCHSLNESDYNYNTGCTGYGRDAVSFIVFTAADPKKPETLNNRKTSRQMFMYKPQSKLLLQSRMYRSSGGVYGQDPRSKEYRHCVERIIAECEGFENKWVRSNYKSGKWKEHICVNPEFGGYMDWEEFPASLAYHVSLKEDGPSDEDELVIGNIGLCLGCGASDVHLFCDDCKELRICTECHQAFYERDMYEYVQDCFMCESCAETHLTKCPACGELVSEKNLVSVDGETFCVDCVDEYTAFCFLCDKHHIDSDRFTKVILSGNLRFLCDDCLKKLLNDNAIVKLRYDGALLDIVNEFGFVRYSQEPYLRQLRMNEKTIMIGCDLWRYLNTEGLIETCPRSNYVDLNGGFVYPLYILNGACPNLKEDGTCSECPLSRMLPSA